MELCCWEVGVVAVNNGGCSCVVLGVGGCLCSVGVCDGGGRLVFGVVLFPVLCGGGVGE